MLYDISQTHMETIINHDNFHTAQYQSRDTDAPLMTPESQPHKREDRK